MLDLKSTNYDWQFLRDFFQITYLRHLVTWFALVPVAVVAFGNLPETATFITPAGEKIVVNLELPFRWWILWISSLLYTIALILYASRSPKFIRRYKNYASYLTWDHSERWIIWEWYYFLKARSAPERLQILIDKRLAIPLNGAPDLQQHMQTVSHGDLVIYEPKKEEVETWFLFRMADRYFRLGLGPASENSKNKHSELFWELFGAEAKSRFKSRMLIWSLLMCAGVLFAFTVLQNIWAVFRYLGFPWC